MPGLIRGRRSWPAASAAACAALGVVASVSVGTAQESVQAMEAAAELYRDVAAMCADFEQAIEVRLARRTIQSAGRVCQQRPNLFSMRFSDPDGDMVISDGEFFWVYYPSLDDVQVNRYPVSDAPASRDFFRELLEDPGVKYDAEEGGVEAVGGRECRVVTLTPRAGAAYDRARLWVDTGSHVIRRLEIHEQSGNVRTVTLRGLDLSPSIDPGTFVFEVPEGARIRGGGGSGDRGLPALQ
ncbi:MAG: outer membrane lipoprotein carrier protein LolA [Gemmatimonadetes bacterium]|nr:outer membrane lipoprotein carrier protein LolA [Gemmatimonadota bacterium]MYC93285.1 outer membrane lipoprotein carrier protein LolA [Gemmatimonadota bacterium]